MKRIRTQFFQAATIAALQIAANAFLDTLDNANFAGIEYQAERYAGIQQHSVCITYYVYIN